MFKRFREFSLPLKILIMLGIFAAFLGFTVLFALIVMLLWNWLMPDIFGLPAIDVWHAWGLLLLTHILFKSWGGRHWGPRRHRREGRFERESDEGPAPAPSGEA